jgi:precorrin-4 methylase
MKVMQSETLWNEEIRRRCEVVDIAEKVREAKLRRYGHVIRRDEGEPVRDME